MSRAGSKQMCGRLFEEMSCTSHTDQCCLLVILVLSTAFCQRDKEETGGCQLISSKCHSGLWRPSLQCSLGVFQRCFPEMFSWECREVSAGLEGSRWHCQVFEPDVFDMQQFWERGQVKTENKSVFTTQTKLVQSRLR